MNKWINAAEELPNGNGEIYEGCLEESSLVLVCGRDYHNKNAYGLGRYIIDHNNPKDSGWNRYMDCEWDLGYCNVTHWMPLPEPPKGE